MGAAFADVSSFQPYQQQVLYQHQQQQTQYSTEPIPIIRQEQVFNPDGSYKWRYVFNVLLVFIRIKRKFIRYWNLECFFTK